MFDFPIVMVVFVTILAMVTIMLILWLPPDSLQEKIANEIAEPDQLPKIINWSMFDESLTDDQILAAKTYVKLMDKVHEFTYSYQWDAEENAFDQLSAAVVEKNKMADIKKSLPLGETRINIRLAAAETQVENQATHYRNAVEELDEARKMIPYYKWIAHEVCFELLTRLPIKEWEEIENKRYREMAIYNAAMGASGIRTAFLLHFPIIVNDKSHIIIAGVKHHRARFNDCKPDLSPYSYESWLEISKSINSD